MDLALRHLRTVRAIADAGSLTRDRTRIVLPAVSDLQREAVRFAQGERRAQEGLRLGGTHGPLLGALVDGGTTFFQPVNPILQAYGLTLKTTGSDPGDPGDPGEPGGTWSAGTVYQAGDTVTYGGATYRCLQGHQAQAGWEPPNVPALWQRV